MAAETNDSLCGWNDTFKVWDPAFELDITPEDSGPYIETKRRESDLSSSSIRILFKEHQEFCRGISINDITSGFKPVGGSSTAWLDEREYSSGMSSGIRRGNKCAFSAAELYEALKKPVCPVQSARVRLIPS